MRVLQLTGDWKWTGPAGPMLDLSLALRERGHEVWLACPEAPPDAAGALAERAREAGLGPELLLGRGRGVRLLGDARDAARVRALLETRDVEENHG